MTKDEILERAQHLLGPGRGAEPTRMLTGALTLMTSVYGDSSPQVRALLHRRDEIAALPPGTYLPDYKNKMIVASIVGAIVNLIEEVKAGILGSVERRVTSDVLSD